MLMLLTLMMHDDDDADADADAAAADADADGDTDADDDDIDVRVDGYDAGGDHDAVFSLAGVAGPAASEKKELPPEAVPEAAARGRPRGWRQRLSSLRECPTDTRRCACGNVVTDTRRRRRKRARARETPKPRRYTGRLPWRKEEEEEDEEDREYENRPNGV